MIRSVFVLMLILGSIMVSGARKAKFEQSITEKEKIKAAETLVTGTQDKSGKLQKYAAENPMCFITIETGYL